MYEVGGGTDRRTLGLHQVQIYTFTFYHEQRIPIQPYRGFLLLFDMFNDIRAVSNVI